MTCKTTVLLTGATGLVGRFLLAGLLRRQQPTIVLVRSQPHRSAQQRIEEALAPFESSNLLPRPIVLAADLARADLGLDPHALSLLRQLPLRILHSAASIRFQADGPHDEPYVTNVTGTQNLLRACAEWQVTQFHHVSTAYVQCDRSLAKTAAQRTAFEVPVRSTSLAGNDYERSKIQSETLILNCPHIGPKSIYRPSIVVGDSQSGYTSTYHGFYAPLQIASGLVRNLGLDIGAADTFREHLGLEPGDSKNLVPVDWLATAILNLMEHPAALGNIFHLTHPKPALLIDMQRAIIDALAEFLPSKPGKAEPAVAFAPEAFRDQMAVYETYFQNDPAFDRRNTDEFLRGLPCPEMDYATLKRLAHFALNANFGWPRPAPVPVAVRGWECKAASNGVSKLASANLRDACLELQVLGVSSIAPSVGGVVRFCRRGGEWQLNSELSSSTAASVMRLTASEQSLQSALDGTVDIVRLLQQGRWVLSGDQSQDWLEVLSDWVKHVTIRDAENAV